MYTSYFHLKEFPFSIAPDPAFLYMSPRHQEALGHLLYGTGQYGGFVQLTGEVGTGKTTIIRTLLAQKLDNVDAAMIHNPRQSEQEFVQSICDELAVPYVREGATLKTLVDALNKFLLAQHEKGRRTVLIIDEAQQLAPEVLEQVRLLTNLETSKEKLLRIMLVGQPELSELLARNDLRQLAQRITARYHLTPLNAGETAEYIAHRLQVAGGASKLFTPAAIKAIYKHSGGVPRLINVLCDRALLGAYSQSAPQVTVPMVNGAAAEVFGVAAATAASQAGGRSLAASALRWLEVALAVGAVAVALGLALKFWQHREAGPATVATAQPGTPAFVGPLPQPAAAPVALAPPPAAPEKIAAAPPVPEPVAARPPPPPAPKAPPTAVPAPATTTTAAAPPAPAPVPVTPPPAPAPASKLVPNSAALSEATAPLNEQMLRLGRIWLPGFKANRAEPPCRGLHRSRLECLRGSGEWSELAAMNAPAILTLSMGKNDVRYVLLRALGKDSATLLGPKGPQQIATKQLDSLWTGEYLVVWKRETDELTIGPETRGEPILWLRQRLAQRLGAPVGNIDNLLWDLELKTAVQHFQTANGIRPDGIAGARTLMALASGSNLPRLRKNG